MAQHYGKFPPEDIQSDDKLAEEGERKLRKHATKKKATKARKPATKSKKKQG